MVYVSYDGPYYVINKVELTGTEIYKNNQAPTTVLGQPKIWHDLSFIMFCMLHKASVLTQASILDDGIYSKQSILLNGRHIETAQKNIFYYTDPK